MSRLPLWAKLRPALATEQHVEIGPPSCRSAVLLQPLDLPANVDGSALAAAVKKAFGGTPQLTCQGCAEGEGCMHLPGLSRPANAALPCHLGWFSNCRGRQLLPVLACSCAVGPSAEADNRLSSCVTSSPLSIIPSSLCLCWLLASLAGAGWQRCPCAFQQMHSLLKGQHGQWTALGPRPLAAARGCKCRAAIRCG